LAFEHHPDRNRAQGAADRFIEVKEAYEILCDSDKRARYDQFGHAGVDGGFGSGGAGGFEGFGGGFPFGDIFETFFGGGAPHRNSPRRGSDLRYDLTVEFEESIFGCERDLRIPRMEGCHVCSGSGAEPGTQPTRCTRCNGEGQIRRVQQSMLGQFVNVVLCNACQGKGTVITSPCGNCNGQGMERVTRQLRITVPAGIDDGTQIRLSGEGEPGANNGPRGNLYVVVGVKPHDVFRREANDIVIDLPINMAQAALGDEIEVPTVDGPAILKVPAGTQPNRVLRIKGKGVPYLRDRGRGDQLVRVSVAVPTRLSEEQRELLRRLEDSFKKDSGDESLLDKLAKKVRGK